MVTTEFRLFPAFPCGQFLVDFRKERKTDKLKFQLKQTTNENKTDFAEKRKETYFSCVLKIYFDKFSHEKNLDLLIFRAEIVFRKL